MSKFYINIKQNFYFCKNKIVNVIEKCPFYLNKIKEFCIYIITFLKTQFQNLIALKNIKFSLSLTENFSSAKILVNACGSLIAFTIILIVIIYVSFIFDILIFLLKTIGFIIWKIPKYLIVKIKNLMIYLLSTLKFLIKTLNNFLKKPQTTEIIEEKKIDNYNNNEIKKLNEKIDLQFKLIQQLLNQKTNEKIIKKPKIIKKTNLKGVKNE